MVHAHYKGLATRKHGEEWFGVTPGQPTNMSTPGGTAAA